MSPVIRRVHAELLPNIRSITLSIELDAVQPDISASVLLTILVDQRQVLLVCGEDSRSFHLPAPTAQPPTSDVFHPTKLSATIKAGSVVGEITVRLPVASSWSPTPWDSLLADLDSGVPWTATALHQLDLECVHCRRCRQTVIPPFTLSEWRDMPSDGWAEMMDFWHCHKPPEPQEAKYTGKGYGPSRTLLVKRGVALVDAHALRVVQDDCHVQILVDRFVLFLRPPAW